MEHLFFDSTLKIVIIYLKTMLSKNTLPQEQSEYQSHDMPNCFQKTFREHFELWTQFLQFFNALKVTGLQNGCGTRKLSSPIRLTNAILYLRNNIIYLRLYCYHLWGNKEHTSKKKVLKMQFGNWILFSLYAMNEQSPKQVLGSSRTLVKFFGTIILSPLSCMYYSNILGVNKSFDTSACTNCGWIVRSQNPGWNRCDLCEIRLNTTASHCLSVMLMDEMNFFFVHR